MEPKDDIESCKSHRVIDDNGYLFLASYHLTFLSFL